MVRGGREEGVGCVLGELLLLQFHASICILSLLCMASCFFTPLLFETTSSTSSEEDRGWRLAGWKKPLAMLAEGLGAGSGKAPHVCCSGVILSTEVAL